MDELNPSEEIQFESVADLSAEAAFDREWALNVFNAALVGLRTEFAEAGKAEQPLMAMVQTGPNSGGTLPTGMFEDLTVGTRFAIFVFTREKCCPSYASITESTSGRVCRQRG